MRIFITGGSGWIGGAVVPELTAAGHDVVGLARSDEAATRLAAAGAKVRRGDLDALDVIREAADESDGVIHLAFDHGVAFSGDFPTAVRADRGAIETLGAALAGSDRPLVIASGILGFPADRVVTEDDGHEDDPDLGGAEGRIANAALTRSFASRRVRSCVLRLPPTVHGDGDHGFVATLVAIAREKGVSGYIEDGTNHWPAVHRNDAARLFRLALEAAPAGSTLHAVADEGVPTRAIAEVIGRHLGVPVTSIASADAPAHFGWLAPMLAADCRASSAITRAQLAWEPTRPGLLDDLAAGHYFGDQSGR